VRLNPTLRTILVPFALTMLVGGAVLVLVLILAGLLPVNLPRAAPEPVLESGRAPTATFQAVGAPPPSPTPTPLPPPDDLTLVCGSNARRFILAHPDGSLSVAASRVLVPPEDIYAYVIADGRLARIPLDALNQDTSMLVMTQTEPLDLLVGGVPLQELADLAYDDTNKALIALSKSGRVFRYTPGGQWGLLRTPELAPDDQADPSYQTIEVADGKAYLLDADLNQVWRFAIASGAEEDNPVARIFPGPREGGTDAVDMLVSADVVLTIGKDGTLRRYNAGDRRPTLDLHLGAPLPLGLQAHDGQVYVVDGLRRAAIAMDTDEDTPHTGLEFAFSDMGLLRDVAFDHEGRVLGLADNTLIVYDPDRQPTGPCEPATDKSVPLDYYGMDLSEALADFRYPIDQGQLPGVPRAYPGARRLYRAGVHEGLDIHPWDVPGSIDIGEPTRAMQDGVVTRADVNYVPLTNAEYNFLTEQAQGLGVSLPDTLDRIGGRKVFIDHGDGISTRYLHLDSIAEGIRPGVEVKRGEIIGTVGVSGTGLEANEVYVVAHAHVEIWIGDYYLGEGLTLRETMWLWQQVFPSVDVAPLP
jgi:hypothetical protein